MNSKKTLQDTLKNGSIIKAMGCYNPIGAKIAQESNFDALWFSGFEFATSNCLPDASILTLTDNINAISTILRVVDLPIIADCDTGFGDLNNVAFLVKEYERIGVSAICIEDKLFPKINSFCKQQQELINIDEFSSKIKVAVDTRKNKDFLVIARIESFIVGNGTSDAIERANAYCEAGADMILIHSKAENNEEIIDFCSNFNKNIPVVIVPTTYYNISIDEIKKISDKIKVIIYANHGIRASISAMQKVFSSIINSGSSSPIESEICSLKEAFKYQNMDKYLSLYDKYGKSAKEIKNV